MGGTIGRDEVCLQLMALLRKSGDHNSHSEYMSRMEKFSNRSRHSLQACSAQYARALGEKDGEYTGTCASRLAPLPF